MPEQFGAPLFDTAGPDKFRATINNIAASVRDVQKAFENLDKKGSPALDRLGQRMDSLVSKADTLGKKVAAAMGGMGGGGGGGRAPAGGSSFPAPGWGGVIVPMTTAQNGGNQPSNAPAPAASSATQPMPAPAQPMDGGSTFSAGRLIAGGVIAASGGARRMMQRQGNERITSDFIGNRIAMGAAGDRAYNGGFKRMTERQVMFGYGGYKPTGFNDRADLSEGTAALVGVAGAQFGTQRFSDIARVRDTAAIIGGTGSAEAAQAISGYYGAAQFYRSQSLGLRPSVGVGGKLQSNPWQMAEEVSRRTSINGRGLTLNQISAQSGPGGQLYENLMRATGGNQDLVNLQITRLQAQTRYSQTHNGKAASESDLRKMLGDTEARSAQHRAEGAAARRTETEIGTSRANQVFNEAVAKFDQAVARLERLGHAGEGVGAGMGALGNSAGLLGGIGRGLGTVGGIGNAVSGARSLYKIAGGIRRVFGGGNGASTAGEAAESASTAAEGAAGAEAGAASVGGLAAAGGVLAAAGAGYVIGTGIAHSRAGHGLRNFAASHMQSSGASYGKLSAGARGGFMNYKGRKVKLGPKMYYVFDKNGGQNYQYGTGPFKELGPGGPQTGDSGQGKGGGGSTISALESMTSSLGMKYIVTATTNGKHATNSYHYKGEAIDITDAAGASDSPGMLALAKGLAAKYGKGLSELIYSGGGGVFIKDGKPTSASTYSSVLAEHHNHVHVAASPDQLKNVGGLSGMGDTASSGGGGSSLGSATNTSAFSGGGISRGTEGHDYHEQLLGGLSSGGSAMGGASNGGKGGNSTGNGGSQAGTGGGFGSFPQVRESKGGGTALSSSQLDQAITTALGMVGLDDKQFHGGVKKLIMSESGGRPGVVNDYDSNWPAHPSIGVMQTIQPTFNAYAMPGHGDITNPVDNIIAGTRYALKNYGPGMLQGGGRHDKSGKYVGYDRGTYDVDHDQMAMLHKGEMVVRSADAAMSRQRAGRGSGLTVRFDKGSIVVNHNGSDADTDRMIDHIFEKIAERERRSLLGSE